MNSFIGWIGGKRQLRKEIIARFPADGVGRYIEVFGGAGWVLFGKDKVPGQMEVYNDINGSLVNLFRCVKYVLLVLELSRLGRDMDKVTKYWHLLRDLGVSVHTADCGEIDLSFDIRLRGMIEEMRKRPR